MNITRFCLEEEVKKGSWSSEEDQILINYIRTHGEGKWPTLPKRAGLNRSGKSCRLRWLNYLRPDIIRGNITKNEQDIIVKLQGLIGNRWSLIAKMLPGRTDNEIKNYWNTNLSKRCTRPPSTPRRKRSQPRKRNQAKHNQGLLENGPQWNETSTFDYPIIDQNEGSSSHSMAINNYVAPAWTGCINVNNPNVLYSSTMNIDDQNGPPEWLMAPDHDHGQYSKVNTDANFTTRSTLEEEEEDGHLLRFLIDFDSENFNNIFDQDEIHSRNPNVNDQFSRVIEEDHPTFNVDVMDNDPPTIVTSLPYDEPLLLDTYGNLDNQVEIGNDVDKKTEPNMESDLKLDLKKLASFLGVEYDWDDK